MEFRIEKQKDGNRVLLIEGDSIDNPSTKINLDWFVEELSDTIMTKSFPTRLAIIGLRYASNLISSDSIKYADDEEISKILYDLYTIECVCDGLRKSIY